jgi:hypothetical protein
MATPINFDEIPLPPAPLGWEEGSTAEVPLTYLEKRMIRRQKLKDGESETDSDHDEEDGEIARRRRPSVP